MHAFLQASKFMAVTDQSGKFSKALEMLVILEESHEHLQYVELLEATLYSYCTPDIEKSVKEELWRNLIVACNSFGTLLIEQKKFARALGTLKLHRQGILTYY